LQFENGDFTKPIPAADYELAEVSFHLEAARQNVQNRLLKLEATEARLLKALHSAQEAAVNKAQVLAAMSREVRTPMNAIVSTAELLLTSTLDDTQQHYATLVRASATSLLISLQNLLDYSRLEAQQMEFRYVRFSIIEVIEDAFLQDAKRAIDKGLNPVVFVHPNVPAETKSDPLRLRQILQIILDNAIRFTRIGDITLFVKANLERGMIRYEIRDTGPGFPPSKADDLFQPFTRLENHYEDRKERNGLGLAIARLVCVQMGGTIGASSAEGGSCFWFELPIVEAESTWPEENPTLKALKVLLIEPHHFANEMMSTLLTSWGADVHTALRPDEGTELLENNQYTLVILDQSILNMRDMLAQARQSGARIFWLLPFDSHRHRLHMRQHGVSACIRKPIRRADLLARVEAVVALMPKS
ncbi:MAG: hypothetical protein HN348_33590, partial [Proteobacteria bacterium]|nr:hypothetical protein [Pseudomonadota bacterium]